jgi:hypothetical protein
VSNQALETLFATVIATVIGVLLTPVWNDVWTYWRPLLGAPLLALIDVLSILALVVLSLAVLHYFGVLGAGADPLGTRGRNDYDALRQRIASGNWVAREYARKLTIFLDAIDRFFGDAGMADSTLFPHAFGLETPAPLWTAPAFDRCLLLALIYPMAAIFLIWAVSNHIGPAEAALGLKSTDDWRRAAAVAATGLAVFAILHARQTRGRPKGRRFLVLYLIALAGIVVGAIFGVGIGVLTIAFGLAGAIASASVRAGAGAGVSGIAVAVAVAVGITGAFAVAVAVVDALGKAGALALGIACAGVVAGVGAAVLNLTNGIYIRGGRQGIFLSLFSLLMFLFCLACASILSRLPAWNISGPLLLFVGLLTLLNAPFDWFSLGLTRALLRRGLEREKWWLYYYAVVDAVLASLVIALLAITIVVGVQVFDDLAAYGGGSRVLPPMREFLDAIRASPEKPEYWWVYATLFSTMLPSLINLFIAGVSLARGVPGVSSWLLRKMKEGEAVPAYDRLLVALVLTFQGVMGFVIAIAAQGFLFWVIIWQGMPRLGFGILDLAYRVAH